MNIMVLCGWLGMGGTGRIATDISRCWIENGHDVTLVTEHTESTDFYRLHPRVQRVILGYSGPNRSAWQIFKNIRALRNEIRRVGPQVVVGLGVHYGVMAGLAALWLQSRTVICELGVPGQNPMRRGREWLRRRAYCLADAVTSESETVDDWLKNNTWVRRSVVMPKSVQWPLVANDPELAPDIFCKPGRKIILAAGRLSPEKGFDTLLRAFAVAADSRLEWDLVILGSGQCRRELELQVTALGLEGRVLLPGRAGNMAAWYKRTSIFTVSSLHEGGPNVLIEALAYGVPALSFDCDAGPRIIIRDNVDGILVPPGDENAFAVGLARLMDDAALRADMAARAVEARERFSEANCMQQWDRLFRIIGID